MIPCLIYIAFALLWALYATRFNSAEFGKNANPKATFIVNLCLAPIAMLWASYATR